MTRTIHFADDEQAVRRCWPVLRELRPHLSSVDALHMARMVDRGGGGA